MPPASAIRKVAFLGVYSCGSLRHGRILIIAYAMSDSATSFATVPLDELLAAMEPEVAGEKPPVGLHPMAPRLALN